MPTLLLLLGFILFALFLISIAIFFVKRPGHTVRVHSSGMRRIFQFCCPSWFAPPSSAGLGCRLCHIALYYTIYALFTVCYFVNVCPKLNALFPSSLHFPRILSLFLLPLPWVFIGILQFADPGWVTAENVEHYLRIYPYDDVLYSPSYCRTLRIPSVPRSHYCQFTSRRIAYLSFSLTRSRYDHYCPWVLASIGARTHRFFLLFLVTNLMAAASMAHNELRYLISRFRAIAETAELRFVWRVVEFCKWGADQEWVVFANVIGLAIAAGVLLTFFVPQCVNASRNLLLVEKDKITAIERRTGKRYVNSYDRGFVRNWMEVLFPEKVEKHEKIDYTAAIREELQRRRKECEEAK
jgi:hypothetical protein